MMKLLRGVCCLVFLFQINLYCQTPEYLEEKSRKIEAGSPFTKIINRELPADIVYEDENVIAFVPLKKQAQVHLLIVPKKEIKTLNEAQPEDALLLGNMLLIAAKLAKENGIENSGYRVSLNLNEDAGQSVFHIHMHLLGGNTLGPMVDRID